MSPLSVRHAALRLGAIPSYPLVPVALASGTHAVGTKPRGRLLCPQTEGQEFRALTFGAAGRGESAGTTLQMHLLKG
jgi:hypothetical protein